MSAASAFVERKKYKGFVRLILQQGFVQRIAHGFVYMNVQGFARRAVVVGYGHEAARPRKHHICDK